MSISVHRRACILPDGKLMCRRVSTCWVPLALAALAAILLVARLGTGSLLDWDESIYAQQAKEMVQRGDWLTPYWGYDPWLNKPPLYLWSAALLFQLFGTSEFWARLPSALSGIALVLLTFSITASAYGRYAGILSALILLLSGGFLRFARASMLDMMFTCFAYLAVYAYLRLDGRRQRWWYLVWAALALSFLVKSAAVLVPAVPIAMAAVLERRARSTLGSRHFWQGLLLGVLLVAPWHVYMTLLHGQRFVDEYLVVNILARSTDTLEGNAGDALYYLRALYAQFFPWLFLLPLALAQGIRDAARGSSTARLMVGLGVLMLVAYTLVRTKLPWYIVPVYPAAAALIAALLVRWCRPLRAGSALALGLICLAAVLAPRPTAPDDVSRYGAPITRSAFATISVANPRFVVPAALVALLCLLTMGARTGAVRRMGQWSPLPLFACLATVGLTTLRPVFSGAQHPAAVLARGVASTGPDDREPIIVFPNDDRRPSILFYSDRPVVVAWNPRDISVVMTGAPTATIILAKEALPPLAACCTVHVQAEAEDLILGKISTR